MYTILWVINGGTISDKVEGRQNMERFFVDLACDDFVTYIRVTDSAGNIVAEKR